MLYLLDDRAYHWLELRLTAGHELAMFGSSF